MKPFDVFICYKKSSAKDFADHLKSGLEELGLHSFVDSKDIPQMVTGKEEWAQIRNRALEESRVFILIITPGFDLSPEVIREIDLARKMNKEFIYFRHRNLGREIILDLDSEKVDLGKQEQVSFETKEELLRLAHNILFKGRISKAPSASPKIMQSASNSSEPRSGETGAKVQVDAQPQCAMCSKPIHGKPLVEVLDGKTYNFDSRACATTYKKLKSLYGDHFE